MLIYRSAGRVLDARDAMASIGERLRAAEGWSHEDWVGMLLDAGELECALTDAECAAADRETTLTRALRRLSIAVASGMVRSWREDRPPPDDLARILEAWSAARVLVPQARLQARVPEGFAYYGLYPETYISAAEQLAREAPARVTVLGIRSIGTTLSAVVAAMLAACGIAVDAVTVRPRGHPFDRELALAPALRQRLRAAAAAPAHWFAIVDEGPGLSGSSFASVAEVLRASGAPDRRIVLFPSWAPDPAVLRSTRGQDSWRRHPRLAGDFDALWVRDSRLAAPFGVAIGADLSGGAWRGCVCRERPQPAVQPQHERRKFLCGRAGAPHQFLLKFEGLGRLGRPRLARARALADAGFAPRPVGFANGFLATEWLEGVPLDARDASPAFVQHVARYISWLHRHARATADVSPDALLDMMRCNVREGLGDALAGCVEAVAPIAAVVARVPAVAVDGRMLPHEWLRTHTGFVKTDGLSHHDDHFLPGAQDAAWDLAGAAIELSLSPEAERRLVGGYAAATGDHAVAGRLPFWRVAYLAFRLGYTTTAAAALGSATDASRMAQLAAGYRARLARELRVPVAGATAPEPAPR
ncbi:MAG TPA: hypothetical protein VJU87_03825 [Gemmatimonadaceae bacterium]|nr:hypothetical protein [Gemmatimonadaceae bacterium]